MADVTEHAPPELAVATESKSETPIPEQIGSNTPPTSVKTEDAPSQRLNMIPSQSSGSRAPDVGTTPPEEPTQVKAEPVSPPDNVVEAAERPPPDDYTPANGIAAALAAALGNPPSNASTTPPQEPTQVKAEPVSPPDNAAEAAERPQSATPAPANGIAAALATALAASSNASAPATSSSSSTVTSSNSAPAEDSAQAKRSRSSEPGDQNHHEKRQKTEHVEEPQPMEIDDTKAESALEPEPEAEASSLLGWDLGAQLSSVLGSVEPESGKDANGAMEETPMDIMPTIPLLPPPRKRPEKMKFIENPTYFSRAMALPMLGSLSVQILLALFQQPSEVTDRQIRDVRTEGGKVYSALRQTFMAVLKLFTEVTAFLSADDLDVHDPGDRETIQMANLASMCASFYGPGGPTMATAHDNFLKIMIPENGMITEDISDLYLDQKTQSFLAYANVMEDKESTRNSLMDKFFPLDLEAKLKEYWKDSNLNLTKTAEEFVQPYTDRRNLLRAVGHDKEKRKALEAKYQFATFLDNLSAFIRSNFDSILDYAESHGFEVPNEAGEEDLMLMDAVASSSYQGSFPGQPRRSTGGEVGYDSQGLASLISEKLNGFDGFTYAYGSSSGGIPESTTLPPTQSLPTSVLYERARQAAVAKSSAHARREGLHSTRRPWTPEEEKALMAGLDLVKGPHWSQILQLFGQNGTISDILKDRTQVQLKDKARNLKLFFLKTNSEMPYYLQCVTGELKTRAPSQAARKEAEEQARVQAGGSPSTYASSYANGTTNGTSTLAQSLASASSTRPNAAGTPTGSTTTGATAGSSHPPQQSYQQQTHPNQRPQQLQPAANGTTYSSHTTSQQAAKPLSAQPQHHQPIAPAPSYQRPLQQAPNTTTSQYQQRPVQQAGSSSSASYQQAHQQPQRTQAAISSSTIPPRPAAASTAPQNQSRLTSTISQPPSAHPRPASALATNSSRPMGTPGHGAVPSSASGPVATPKSVPTIMPAPPSSASPSPAPPSARPAHYNPARPSQPLAQAVGTTQAPISAARTATVAPTMPGPSTSSTTAPRPAAVTAPSAAPARPANTGTNSVQQTTDAADDELLIKSLQAALHQDG